MNIDQLSQLLKKGTFMDQPLKGKLIETHISWVILAKSFVFKIKKPMQYSFLDFSTLSRRQFYCERELELNRRLSDIYLDVLPVRLEDGQYSLGQGQGKIIDFAVRMKRMLASKKMDVRLQKDEVTFAHIETLAEKIASFHQGAEIIREPFSRLQLKNDFNDLLSVTDWLGGLLKNDYIATVKRAVANSDTFLKQCNPLLTSRVEQGYRRDLHGDLHAKNIFLYKDPIIFDCIEFNDGFRQIDLLNELAFFCMDLDSFGKEALGRHFMEQYLKLLPCMENKEAFQLFVYYKCYRANVRAKVNALRAMQAPGSCSFERHLNEVRKYLRLMDGYIDTNLSGIA